VNGKGHNNLFASLDEVASKAGELAKRFQQVPGRSGGVAAKGPLDIVTAAEFAVGRRHPLRVTRCQ
jgi:hypothetical protein